MQKFVTEYRINKKGAECFRSRDFQETRQRLDDLSRNRPDVYAMQSRHCPVNRYGVMLTAGNGVPHWTCWQ